MEPTSRLQADPKSSSPDRYHRPTPKMPPLTHPTKSLPKRPARTLKPPDIPRTAIHRTAFVTYLLSFTLTYLLSRHLVSSPLNITSQKLLKSFENNRKSLFGLRPYPADYDPTPEPVPEDESIDRQAKRLGMMFSPVLVLGSLGFAPRIARYLMYRRGWNIGAAQWRDIFKAREGHSHVPTPK